MQKSFREICLANVNASNRSGKCLIIGEIAQAHDGSLGTAHAYIDAIANAGADAVKFQTHIASAESTLNEPWRVKFSKQDATRFDYWKRMEFTPAQWRELKQHADERNLLFLSTPFSNEAIDLLQEIEIQAWKVASGEINNIPALEKMAETGKPIILSSGMSAWSELDKAVDLINKLGNRLAVLQCTTAYPCPPEKIGLNVLQELKERYENCAVGLSDHSGTIYAGLAAAALEAEILEIHVTFSREMFGPDVPASVTTQELKQLVEGIRFIEQAQENPVNKDVIAAEMNPLRGMFTKSVVAAFEIPAGTILRPEHFALKKPGSGLSADFIPALTNQRLKRPLQTDEFLRLEDVEPQ